MKLKGVKIKLKLNESQKNQIDINISLRRFVKNQLLNMQQTRYRNGGNYTGSILFDVGG